MNNSRSFEDLNIYKRSVQIRKDIFELVKSFPADEKFRLTDQIIRSTRKCPANIAEGHGRYHFQENIQFNRIARASLTETLDHINVATECNYINVDTSLRIKTLITENIKMINAYINYLKQQKLKQTK